MLSTMWCPWLTVWNTSLRNDSTMADVITVITGGIGSGKSVVSRMLAVMGYPTYDCDSRAKWLMQHDAHLRSQLSDLLGEDIYNAQGQVRRDVMASRIFGDKQLLEAVNAVVHPAVRTDIEQWAEACCAKRVFVETALLDESGLRNVAHDTWLVDAPVAVRVERVMHRSNLSVDEVNSRIRAQRTPLDCDHIILNDGAKAVLPQVLEILGDT